MQLGLSSSPAINEWINQSWQKKYMRKSGAIPTPKVRAAVA